MDSQISKKSCRDKESSPSDIEPGIHHENQKPRQKKRKSILYRSLKSLHEHVQPVDHEKIAPHSDNIDEEIIPKSIKRSFNRNDPRFVKNFERLRIFLMENFEESCVSLDSLLEDILNRCFSIIDEGLDDTDIAVRKSSNLSHSEEVSMKAIPEGKWEITGEKELVGKHVTATKGTHDITETDIAEVTSKERKLVDEDVEVKEVKHHTVAEASITSPVEIIEDFINPPVPIYNQDDAGMQENSNRNETIPMKQSLENMKIDEFMTQILNQILTEISSKLDVQNGYEENVTKEDFLEKTNLVETLEENVYTNISTDPKNNIIGSEDPYIILGTFNDLVIGIEGIVDLVIPLTIFGKSIDNIEHKSGIEISVITKNTCSSMIRKCCLKEVFKEVKVKISDFEFIIETEAFRKVRMSYGELKLAM